METPEPAPRRIDPASVLRFVVFPAAVLALILGTLWYIDTRLDGSSGDAYGIVELPDAKNPTDERPLADEGRAGPDFLLEALGGGTLRLSDLQGKAVLLNFWATWCGPCRQEVPHLVDAYERYGEQGLVVLGVDLQEPNTKVQRFVDEFGITYPVAFDRDGEVADTWRVGGPVNQGLPTSYFIDATGVVRERFFGPLDEDALAERIAEILPEAGG
jgi:peroxiredoxin